MPDGHDPSGPFDHSVAGIAGGIEDVEVALDGAVAEPVLAQDRPEVLEWVELGRAWRKEHERERVWHFKLGRDVAARSRTPIAFVPGPRVSGFSLPSHISSWDHRSTGISAGRRLTVSVSQ